MKTTIEMTGADYMLKILEQLGIECIYGYPGGAVLPFYDALNKSPIQTVLVRHEQGAAMAANGYARARYSQPGVCLATSGPGGTNMVTGIGDAYADSVPLIALAGQVPTNLIGTDAFQEVDITGICAPITKKCYTLTDIKDAEWIFREAYEVALNGRPGPVLVELPKNVQAGKVELPISWERNFQKPIRFRVNNTTEKALGQATELLQKARRPLIIAGHGVYLSEAAEEFRHYVERENLPVVTTIHGKDVLPQDHNLCFSWLGMHGMKYANEAVQEADLIYAIGIRFDDRITGKLDTFAPNAKVIHIDIDSTENSKNVRANAFLHADVKEALAQMPLTLTDENKLWRADWVGFLRGLKEEYPLYCQHEGQIFNQIAALQLLNGLKDESAWVATDVGQHQMWAGQYLDLKPGRFLTSGGMGTMGFGLPAAMGICQARPEDEVWAVMGDGSFMMNMQELMTCAQENYNLKMIVLDNAYLGMVRQWQEQFFKNNLSGVAMANPNFAQLAEAFGIRALMATNQTEMRQALHDAQHHQGPVLIHAAVVREDKVLPMVPPGKSLSDTLYYSDFPDDYPTLKKVPVGQVHRLRKKQ